MCTYACEPREGRRERIFKQPPDRALDLRTPEFTTRAETKSWTLNGQSHPGAPTCFLIRTSAVVAKPQVGYVRGVQHRAVHGASDLGLQATALHFTTLGD